MICIASVTASSGISFRSRNKTGRIARCSTAMTATSASQAPSSMICHNCDKAGHNRSGCAVPAKPNRKINKPAGQKRNLDQRAVLGRSGALCIRRSRATTPHATRKGLHAHSRVVRAQFLWWEPKPASMIPTISRLLIVTTTSARASL